MKKKITHARLLVTCLQVGTIIGSIFYGSAVIGQTRPNRAVGSSMPDEFQLTYHVAIKDLTQEVEQRVRDEQAQTDTKDVKTSQQKRLPVAVHKRKFDIRIAQSQQKFYWASEEKNNPANFIYDGKRSYYYDRIAHTMFVHTGFRLVNGMTWPLPGRSLANIPMVLHASEATPGSVEGEVYTGMPDAKDKPAYMPGRIEMNPTAPDQIDRASCYIHGKKDTEHIFRDYVNFGGITIAAKIVDSLYYSRSKEKQDVLFLEYQYQMSSSSLSSPPPATFDPITLFPREKEGTKTSPEFVQWYFEGDREVTFMYQPGKSLEEQAGIEDYQQKKAVNHIENGRVDPRNYVGLGLLLFLLAMAGWKVKAVLTGRQKT